MKSFYEMLKLMESVSTAPGVMPQGTVSASNPAPSGVSNLTGAQKSQDNRNMQLNSAAQKSIQNAQDMAEKAAKKAEEEQAKKRNSTATDFIKKSKELFAKLAKAFGIQSRY